MMGDNPFFFIINSESTSSNSIKGIIEFLNSNFILVKVWKKKKKKKSKKKLEKSRRH